MRDTQQIMKYLVEFNRLAARVQWGDASLRCQLYNGLPPQIKDEISRVGKPDNLTDLCLLAQSIDACYWECCSEIACKMLANKSQVLHSVQHQNSNLQILMTQVPSKKLSPSIPPSHNLSFRFWNSVSRPCPTPPCSVSLSGYPD